MGNTKGRITASYYKEIQKKHLIPFNQQSEMNSLNSLQNNKLL